MDPCERLTSSREEVKVCPVERVVLAKFCELWLVLLFKVYTGETGPGFLRKTLNRFNSAVILKAKFPPRAFEDIFNVEGESGMFLPGSSQHLS